MNEEKRNCTCWLEVGSCYCETEKADTLKIHGTFDDVLKVSVPQKKKPTEKKQ